VKASSSKCTGFKLAFARGLRWWFPAATRSDLHSPLRWQCAQAVVFGHDLLGMAVSARGEKTLRVSASIYKSAAAPPTTGWISLQKADSAAAPNPSTSTNRRASSRGLGYIYSTLRVATRFKSNSGHLLHTR
jgi:hypothetical protein